jgi:hypothetical protein
MSLWSRNELSEACCKSQLRIIRLNLERLQKKLFDCEWSTDAEVEFQHWVYILNEIFGDIIKKNQKNLPALYESYMSNETLLEGILETLQYTVRATHMEFIIDHGLKMGLAPIVSRHQETWKLPFKSEDFISGQIREIVENRGGQAKFSNLFVLQAQVTHITRRVDDKPGVERTDFKRILEYRIADMQDNKLDTFIDEHRKKGFLLRVEISQQTDPGQQGADEKERLRLVATWDRDRLNQTPQDANIYYVD